MHVVSNEMARCRQGVTSAALVTRYLGRGNATGANYLNFDLPSDNVSDMATLEDGFILQNR